MQTDDFEFNLGGPVLNVAKVIGCPEVAASAETSETADD